MLERLEAAGYEEIIPPTFEYAEVFVRAGGADVADKLIRFLDLDGQLLALRYDFTASAARLAATKLSDRATPLRVCYTGNVFRQDPGRRQAPSRDSPGRRRAAGGRRRPSRRGDRAARARADAARRH